MKEEKHQAFCALGTVELDFCLGAIQSTRKLRIHSASSGLTGLQIGFLLNKHPVAKLQRPPSRSASKTECEKRLDIWWKAPAHGLWMRAEPLWGAKWDGWLREPGYTENTKGRVCLGLPRSSWCRCQRRMPYHLHMITTRAPSNCHHPCPLKSHGLQRTGKTTCPCCDP